MISGLVMFAVSATAAFGALGNVMWAAVVIVNI